MVMVIGLVGFGLPTPASATTQVFSCHIDYSSYWVKAWCDYGLGGVRAAGYCWDGYGDVAYYGPWKPAGQVSEMICGGGRVLDGAWYETW
jgi:hypothetical protein